MMFMDNIFVDFFDDRLSNVSHYFSSELVFLHSLTFVDVFMTTLFSMLNNDWFFIYLLDDRSTLVLLRTNVGFSCGIDGSASMNASFNVSLSDYLFTSVASS